MARAEGELHTQTCPICKARDEETKLTKIYGGPDLRGVYFTGMFEGSHEWQCMECGHNWLTKAGFVRDGVAA